MDLAGSIRRAHGLYLLLLTRYQAGPPEPMCLDATTTPRTFAKSRSQQHPAKTLRSQPSVQVIGSLIVQRAGSGLGANLTGADPLGRCPPRTRPHVHLALQGTAPSRSSAARMTDARPRRNRSRGRASSVPDDTVSDGYSGDAKVQPPLTAHVSR